MYFYFFIFQAKSYENFDFTVLNKMLQSLRKVLCILLVVYILINKEAVGDVTTQINIMLMYISDIYKI